MVRLCSLIPKGRFCDRFRYQMLKLIITIGIEDGCGGEGNNGIPAIGGECIKSAFRLTEKSGIVIWVKSVRHAYVITDEGIVKNLLDQNFNYPNFSSLELKNMVSKNEALILTSITTAAEQIVNIDRR